MKKLRVALAMSGGVDSSVAVAILKEQGHEVIGIHMKLHDSAPEERRDKSCCSLDDTLDARSVCSLFDIPFYVVDFRDEFKENVIDYFVQEYVDGRTPNPCVMCNKTIKNQFLLEKADELDCDYLATGHYARISQNQKTGKLQIRKPHDLRKDQTYFLFGTPQYELSRLLFPLADYTKPQVREIATKHGLISAKKPDSQEICFVPQNYRDFISGQLVNPPTPGNFVTTSGEVLGQHKGIPFYTIGQRRGLNISGTNPYYVIRIDKEKNEVVLGTTEETFINKLDVSEVNWVSIDPIQEETHITVKLRYAHKGAKAKVIPLSDNEVKIILDEPERAATPGQAAVFYDQDVLLGGGWINSCQF